MTSRLQFAAYWFVGLTILMTTGQADAAALRLTEGANQVTVVDGGAGDANPAAGAVTFIGDVGVFSINVSTGITKPILGSASFPEMHLNSVNVSTAPGTLTIEFTETDFTNFASIPAFLMQFGGVTDGTISYSAYLDNNNTAFGQGTLIASSQLHSNGAFAEEFASNIVPSDEPYSLTQVVTITHGAGTLDTSFDATLQAVPEPGAATLALIGIAIGGLSFMRRRRTTKTQAT
jgi:hypothetical protein